MNNVRNWLLGTLALVVATSILLAAFSTEGGAGSSATTTVDAMQAPH